MKTLFKTIQVSVIIIISITLISSFGCTKDEISGDANLKIINKCSRTISIYFDGTKLGTVSSDNDEKWDVPSGTHTVKATCYMATDYEQSHKFTSGNTTVISLDLNIRDKTASITHSY